MKWNGSIGIIYNHKIPKVKCRSSNGKGPSVCYVTDFWLLKDNIRKIKHSINYDYKMYVTKLEYINNK